MTRDDARAASTADIIAAIERGDLSPGRLTHVLEDLGARPADGVAGALLAALRSPHALVREGAILGLEAHVRRILSAIEAVAEADPSPGVRAVAAEVPR